MYNRYIPQESNYTQVERPADKKTKPPQQERRSVSEHGNYGRPGGREPAWQMLFPEKSALRRLVSGGERAKFSDLLKRMHLDSFDSGDLLVLLIILLLASDGDDWDPIIALGLFFLLGFTEEKGEKDRGTAQPSPECIL